jgi:hypothetical protein
MENQILKGVRMPSFDQSYKEYYKYLLMKEKAINVHHSA